MPVDIRIVGADRFGEIARHLKAVGDKEMRKELMRGVNRAVKPLKAAAKEAALSELPKGGGLNVFVSDMKIGVRTRSGSRNPGVRMTGKKSGHDLRAIDRGRLRHPVYGHDWWVTQQITPGWWSKTLPEHAPEVRRELVRVLDDIARRLARG